MSLVDNIHQLISRQRLLDHPFYEAWSKGHLTRDLLQAYGTQYYHWVQAFPTWLSAVHANADTLPMRQVILDNLIDEERGAENHIELWLRFTDALGIDRDTVTAAQLLPETARAIVSMRRICRDQPAVAGIAALYAYESQQPEVMKTKRAGLRDLYGVPHGHDYFLVHETADVEHSRAERTLIEARGPGHAASVLSAVQNALDATYTMLDGVNRIRHAD